MTKVTVATAIRKAMTALEGTVSILEVAKKIQELYGPGWKDIRTPMADLTCPGSPSSPYPPKKRFLVRIGRGLYKLREPFTTDAPTYMKLEGTKGGDSSFATPKDIFSHLDAESVLRAKGILKHLLKSLTSAIRTHDEICGQLLKDGWETEVRLFPHAQYRADALRDRIVVEIESVDKTSVIDVIHRDFLRFLVLYQQEKIDAGVLVVRAENKRGVNFHRVTSDLREFGDAVSVPILVVGI